MTNPTPQAANDALDYLDDMTGVRELDIPGGRSPVAFLSRYGELIRALLTAAAQPAPNHHGIDPVAQIEAFLSSYNSPEIELAYKGLTGKEYKNRKAKPATDTTGEGVPIIGSGIDTGLRWPVKPTETKAALLSKPAAIPEGYAILPIESTPAMNRAADMTGDPWDVWKRMVYASPSPPQKAQKEDGDKS